MRIGSKGYRTTESTISIQLSTGHTPYAQGTDLHTSVLLHDWGPSQLLSFGNFGHCFWSWKLSLRLEVRQGLLTETIVSAYSLMIQNGNADLVWRLLQLEEKISVHSKCGLPTAS